MAPHAHATLGASGSKRWMSCPGSVALSKGLPDETSVYALEGSAAHELAEYMLMGGSSDELTEVWVDDADNPGPVTVTDEMRDAVQVYVDECRSRMTPGCDVHVELEMSLEALQPPEEMFGTGDCVIWDPSSKTLHIIDYKHGQGVAVDAVGNTQLRYYALAAVVTLRVRPDVVRMTIVQPRAHHPAGPIRHDEISFSDLIAFKQELFEAARRTQDPGAPLAVGDHCRFCRALAVCPAQAQQAIEGAQHAFDVVPEGGTEPAIVSPRELTPAQLATALRLAGPIKDWLAAVELHCVGLLDSGREVPGFKLIEGRKGNTQWVDERAADTFLKGQGVKAGARYTKKLVSPTQALALLKKEKGRKELPERLVTRADGKPKIVPSDDTRPALPASIEAFGALPAAN